MQANIIAWFIIVAIHYIPKKDTYNTTAGLISNIDNLKKMMKWMFPRIPASD